MTTRRGGAAAAPIPAAVVTAPVARPAPRVVMCVRNHGQYDTRVRKEAVALTRAGYDVTVIALAHRDFPPMAELDGTPFVRLEVPRAMAHAARARYLARQQNRRAAYLRRADRLRDIALRAAQVRCLILRRRTEALHRALLDLLRCYEVAGRLDPGTTAEAEAVFALADAIEPSVHVERHRAEPPVYGATGEDLLVDGPGVDDAQEPSHDVDVPAEQDEQHVPQPVRLGMPRSQRALSVIHSRALLRAELHYVASRYRAGVAGLSLRPAVRAVYVLVRVTRFALRVPYRTTRAIDKTAWVAHRRLLRLLVPATYHQDYWIAVRPVLDELAPDLVHAHDLNTLYGCWRWARRHRRPLVYDAHELELHRNTRWTRRRRVLTWVLEALGTRGAAAVITVSPGIARQLARQYGLREPHVVLNSPPLRASHVTVGQVDLRSVAGLPPRQKLVVYVGKVGHGRGLDVLLQALTIMPPHFHVGVLGPREQLTDEGLRDRAAELGVRDRLHLFDPVPSAAVPGVLRSADCSINPSQNVCMSYDLALPNKLFDALMAGVPVAVGELRALKDFVLGNEVGMVFDETSPLSVAQALQELVVTDFPGLAGERLRALQERHSWEAQCEVLLRVYQHVLPMPGAPAGLAVAGKGAP